MRTCDARTTETLKMDDFLQNLRKGGPYRVSHLLISKDDFLMLLQYPSLAEPPAKRRSLVKRNNELDVQGVLVMKDMVSLG